MKEMTTSLSRVFTLNINIENVKFNLKPFFY